MSGRPLSDEATAADVQALMLTVVGSLGDEAKGRSLQCRPAATIEPATRGAVLLYERSES